MLFQLGPITIDSPSGLNATGTMREFGGDFAVKPVVGAQQPREFVGPSDGRIQIVGKLFPFGAARAGMPTGLPEIDLLESMSASGEPQILVRGDGTNLGYWLIEKVNVSTQNLSSTGIGRDIDYSINIVQSSNGPSAASLLSVLSSLI